MRVARWTFKYFLRSDTGEGPILLAAEYEDEDFGPPEAVGQDDDHAERQDYRLAGGCSAVEGGTRPCIRR